MRIAAIVLVVALRCGLALQDAPTCGSSEGVFFSDNDFPGTGRFANRLSAPRELQEQVAAWRTQFRAGPLSEEQHAKFFDEGFVIVPDLLPHDVLHQAINSVETLVDDVASELHEAGKINDTFSGAGFYERLSLLEGLFPGASVLLHKKGVLPVGIQRLWSHPVLMDAAMQLLGADKAIMGHPVWNLRCKTPEASSEGQATVPWHQDNAYLDEESWDKLQLTAWVPLLDSNASNGCMQVVRGAHRPGGTLTHACCVAGTWYVEVTPREIETVLGADMESDVVTCEVPFGGVLLLNNLIPHRSLPNHSPLIRWSLDLRWQRADEPNGFHGLKPSVLMRHADQEHFDGQVDWGDWAAQDRTQAQLNALKSEAKDASFDTTIAGPWMKQWPLIHRNRHTANLNS